ncbi:DOA1 Protein DOA1 [Candida maltosa Xu316]|uniref:Uncharacterized protein n=1 Tax=Candida maltosa (strain Xu316) TaxID=1245528 RepID=M3JBV1_CANMX|nr:hypothetical protein G210_5607 [Candida maltosa Xu316]
MSYKLSSTLSGHEQDVKGLVSTPANDLVSVSRDATTRLWANVNTTQSDSTIIFNSPTKSFVNSVTYLNELIASGGQDAMIYLSDLHGDDKYQLIGHQGNVCSLSYSHGQLISSSWDCTAIVWNLEEFVPKLILSGHESSVWDCKVLGEDKYLTCSADKTIRLWQGKYEIRQFSGHSDVIRKLLILPNGKEFLSCSNDGTIKLWDLETGKVLKTFYGHESFVYDLALLPGGKFASTGEDRTTRIWDLSSGNIVQVITLPCISVWCIAVFENGDFAVGGSDNLIRVFTTDPERIASEEELTHFKESVQSSSIAEQSLDNLKKTDIPGYDALTRPGKQEGSTIMVKNDNGTIEAHQWSGGEWVKIGDVVGSSSTGKKKEYLGKEYDYVFDVDIKDGEPPLKLPYNVNDNPYVVAEKFLADNELPATYTEEVVRFLEKNTEGASLQESTAATTTDERVNDPYSDAYTRKHQQDSSLKVIPEKTYIHFGDYKKESLINGLKKLNLSQDAGVQFSNEQVSTIESFLDSLTSKQALEIITNYSNHIIKNWSNSAKLIGFDLLRISIPRVTTVDLLSSTEAAETVLDVLNYGLDSITTESAALLMMILKVLNNLIGNTLFVQLYIDPSGPSGKLYEYNSFFRKLLKKLETTTKKFTPDAKLYATALTTASTLIYNLSVYQLQTTGLKNNQGSAAPVIDCMDTLGDQLVESSSEAAYRLAIAYGNFRYVKSYTKDTPQWLAEAGNLYAINGEQRFIDIASDLQHL